VKHLPCCCTSLTPLQISTEIPSLSRKPSTFCYVQHMQFSSFKTVLFNAAYTVSWHLCWCRSKFSTTTKALTTAELKWTVVQNRTQTCKLRRSSRAWICAFFFSCIASILSCNFFSVSFENESFKSTARWVTSCARSLCFSTGCRRDASNDYTTQQPC